MTSAVEQIILMVRGLQQDELSLLWDKLEEEPFLGFPEWDRLIDTLMCLSRESWTGLKKIVEENLIEESSSEKTEPVVPSKNRETSTTKSPNSTKAKPTPRKKGRGPSTNTPGNIRKIQKLRKHGWGWSKIGAHFNLSRWWASDLLKRHGKLHSAEDEFGEK